MLLPLHEPERKSNTASKLKEPTTVITCEAAFATKLYQTSSSAVPLQGAAAKDCVAPNTFPVVALPHVAP